MLFILERIRFYFVLHGFKGGFKFALNVIRCNTERNYLIVLKDTKYRKDIANSSLTFKLVRNEATFDELFKNDYKMKKLILVDRGDLKFPSKEWLGIIYLGKAFAGWGWVKFGPSFYGSYQVNSNHCVIHKCRTLPRFRRQGVYVTLLILLLDELQKNIEKAYIGAKKFNIASLAAIEKVGFDFLEEYNTGSFLYRIKKKIVGNS